MKTIITTKNDEKVVFKKRSAKTMIMDLVLVLIALFITIIVKNYWIEFTGLQETTGTTLAKSVYLLIPMIYGVIVCKIINR